MKKEGPFPLKKAEREVKTAEGESRLTREQVREGREARLRARVSQYENSHPSFFPAPPLGGHEAAVSSRARTQGHKAEPGAPRQARARSADPGLTVPARQGPPTPGRSGGAAAHLPRSPRRRVGGPVVRSWQPLIWLHSNKTFRALR